MAYRISMDVISVIIVDKSHCGPDLNHLLAGGMVTQSIQNKQPVVRLLFCMVISGNWYGWRKSSLSGRLFGCRNLPILCGVAMKKIENIVIIVAIIGLLIPPIWLGLIIFAVSLCAAFAIRAFKVRQSKADVEKHE